MSLQVKHDKKADAIYVRFTKEKWAYTRQVDNSRYVDYASDDKPIGVELLCVSDGVNLHDLPRSQEIESALADMQLKVYA